MGYNAYNHFGAYMEVPEIEKTTKKKIRRCSDTKCKNHKNEKMSVEAHFCNVCGTEIEEFEKEKKEVSLLSYYSFCEEHGLDPEKFSQVQEGYMLIPNYRFGTVANWSDEDNQKTIPFVWGDSRKALVEFTNEAQDFIDKVKEVYGVEIEVKFGIVSYVM